jgi:polysaccharide biosynthesis/export protein
LTPFADEDAIKIVRKVDGNDVVLRFDYSQVRKGRGLQQNIQLRSGDTVVVP